MWMKEDIEVARNSFAVVSYPVFILLPLSSLCFHLSVLSLSALSSSLCTFLSSFFVCTGILILIFHLCVGFLSAISFSCCTFFLHYLIINYCIYFLHSLQVSVFIFCVFCGFTFSFWRHVSICCLHFPVCLYTIIRSPMITDWR